MTAPINLDAIEAAARAATPGPWNYTGESYTDGGSQYYEVMDSVRNNEIIGQCGASEADTKFIAAANPAMVLELVERLRKAEADSKRLDFTIERDTTWYPGRGKDGAGILCFSQGAQRSEALGVTMREAIDAAMEVHHG